MLSRKYVAIRMGIQMDPTIPPIIPTIKLTWTCAWTSTEPLDEISVPVEFTDLFRGNIGYKYISKGINDYVPRDLNSTVSCSVRDKAAKIVTGVGVFSNRTGNSIPASERSQVKPVRMPCKARHARF